MRCGRCSANPPMLDNVSYELIWRHWQQKLALYNGCCCPQCGEVTFKRFGRSAVQRPRLQCQACQRTFSVRTPVMTAQYDSVIELSDLLQCRTDGGALANFAAKKGVHFDRAAQQLYHLALASLWQTKSAKNIATAIFIVPYKGLNNALWCLISTNMDSGEILHLSSTLIDVELPVTGQYQPCRDAPAPLWNKLTSAVTKAEQQESRFLHREQFDRCDFGSAMLNKKGVSHALPVLTAHAHFALLNRLGHAVGNGTNVGSHCLQHEVFLRGACITQYAQQVKQHRMSLTYVVGQTQSQCTPHSLRKLGWWQNSWQTVNDTQGNNKAFSVLCGEERLSAEQISLSTSHDAIRYITKQAEKYQLSEFTPTRVNQILAVFAMAFNEALLMAEG